MKELVDASIQKGLQTLDMNQKKLKTHCDTLLKKNHEAMQEFEMKYSYLANEKIGRVTSFVDGMALQQAKLTDKVN